MRLAAEGSGSVAPIAGRHEDADVVSEHLAPMIATRIATSRMAAEA
jgi:hypothetical protein